MLAGPATFLVLLFVGLLIVVSSLLMRASLRSTTASSAVRRCPHCQHDNERAARYCARCGHAVDDGPF